ncbi:MAG: hypothetical protein DWQ04_31240 [Chloroflexi bacterium]|nr:MAG: hypothetical protein DWQ04_31240 [Chloroflexota bacterium]
MTSIEVTRSQWASAASIFAVLFGLLTILSGGSVLLNAQAQKLAGNYVTIVVVFNFLAGFAYVIAGVGLWTSQRWSIWLSLLIAIATLIILAFFGLHILNGGSYEMRTVIVLFVRSAIWFVIFAIAYKNLNPIII